MKTIDELVADKLMDLVQYALSKFIKPDITLEKVKQLDATVIDILKERYGIEGIILDVDETLRKEMKDIPKCNKEWIESLKGQLKVIILSNGKDQQIEQYFRENGIDYIGFAHKPLKKNFLKACEKMDISPEKVLVVGNDLLTDIYGGRRNNMKTVLIKNVEHTER
ncbi:MAG: YqeG family HAD IIIA-type phosphatase [Clostridia bacterium]|nr:YqeG family HAD IIIA-type phosphatase [Clostridia bacterium]